MEYYFYKRKDTGLLEVERQWLEDSLDTISKSERILFVFQAENESILFTSKRVYFPNRNNLEYLEFDKITEIKRIGDKDLHITYSKKTIHVVTMASPVDKVKIGLVLNVLIRNKKKKVNTSFKEIEMLFQELTVIKYPPNQSQHKLPRVYLKQFGYLHKEQWKVSIMERGEGFTRQKSIGSFTAETNIFDIESEDDRYPRMFETLNAEIENLIPEMLEDISKNKIIPDKCWEIIVQFTPNMMARSDYWREFVQTLLESEDKNSFLEITMSVHVTSIEELRELKKKPFYISLSKEPLDNSTLNLNLIHFLNYIFHHLRTFNLVILEAPLGKEFFSSDNPVTFNANQEEGKFGLFSKDSEVYFPLSKKYLAYFHHPNSKKKTPKMRTLKNRGVYRISDILNEQEHNLLLRKEIIEASDKLIIIPDRFDYSRNELKPKI